MDITIQMRSLDLLLKFIKHDMSGIPHYGYRQQKQAPALCGAGERLPRCTPAEAGISCAAVETFFRQSGQETRSLGMHGAMLLRHGKIFAEGWWAPFRPDAPHMLYSVSKSITATAVGIALDEGILDLDEKLSDIFGGRLEVMSKGMKTVTIWHLLTMSTGNRFNEVGSMLAEDWVRMFMESVPKFEPGTAFEYNSLNTYMLAAVLHEKTGIGLLAYLKPRLFDPLGIVEYAWETCPQGIEKGGWGLSLRMEDLAKIGQLYLDRGMWKGKRVLSESWVKQATTSQISTPNGNCKEGYGFQIWMSRGGSYQFNGAFGQYVIMMPKYDAVAVIYGGSVKLFSESCLTEMLEECFGAGGTPQNEDPEAQKALEDELKNLTFSPQLPQEDLGCDSEVFERIVNRLHKKEFRIENTIGSLFPMPLQCVYGCISDGVDMVRFEKKDEGLLLTVYERGERNAMLLRKDGRYSDSILGLREEAQLASTCAQWKEDGEEILLAVQICFVETPDTRLLLMRIFEDNIELIFDETPSVSDATELLLNLVGLMDKATVRRLIPLMTRIPGFNENTINEMVRKYAAPRAFGKCIRCHDLQT